MPAPHCSECAFDSTHWPNLEMHGCTKDMVPHICDASYEMCGSKVRQYCGNTIGHTSSCYSCIKENTRELEMANCTATFAEYACGGGGHRGSKWEDYIDGLACHMHGTWYSTTSTGQCKGKELTPDCWWYIDSEIRTINASCADDRVIEKVQSKRPECWKSCPDGQGKNVSSACYLDCLFETILGNSTSGVPSMNASLLVDAFSGAFTKPVGEGGCQAVHQTTIDEALENQESNITPQLA
mmetsp:Transcript_71397/g.99158  ORF Transcript_71397/g.99158 Transcript_71397/m.99158 type:complete len:240 (-) Transcript_71397:6-725(-)